MTDRSPRNRFGCASFFFLWAAGAWPLEVYAPARFLRRITYAVTAADRTSSAELPSSP